jgi:hypothetical protein
MNKSYTLDYANIGLMILSFIIAFFIPFELFLFSYAVLGPLHYLTEIGWLHQRQYFAKGKYDFVLFIVFGVFITLSNLGFVEWFRVKLSNGAVIDYSIKFIYLAFVSGLIFAFIKETTLKIALVILTWVSFLFLSSTGNFFYSFFGIFLPTIIHVFLFTGAFMLFGAMKVRSIPGMVSVAMLFILASLFFFIIPNQPAYQVSKYSLESWSGGFDQLNFALIKIFNPSQARGIALGSPEYYNLVFNTGYGFAIARFVAFAYTYHYLNWFSKTNVIKWHQVPKKYLIGTVAIWLTAVGIYLYDYTTGLQFLYFLSFLHVLLEFPLNFQSFVGIGKEARNMLTGKTQLAQATPQPTTKKR